MQMCTRTAPTGISHRFTGATRGAGDFKPGAAIAPRILSFKNISGRLKAGWYP
jgi:hypothetical protein